MLVSVLVKRGDKDVTRWNVEGRETRLLCVLNEATSFFLRSERGRPQASMIWSGGEWPVTSESRLRTAGRPPVTGGLIGTSLAK